MIPIRRIFRSLGAGLVAAVLVAVALAVVDLYLTGHGRPSIRDPWIAWDAAGVHLSVADVIWFLAIGIAVAVAYRLGEPHSDP
jgi:hypothetical protein